MKIGICASLRPQVSLRLAKSCECGDCFICEMRSFRRRVLARRASARVGTVATRAKVRREVYITRAIDAAWRREEVS